MTDMLDCFQQLPFISTKTNGRQEYAAHRNMAAKYAAELFENSFAIVKVPEFVQSRFKRLAENFSRIDRQVRENFCFIKKTDGFMPHGTTFARDLQKTDLCQTFNYWHCYRGTHSQYAFSRDPFYTTVASCEVEVHDLCQAILAEVADHYNYEHPLDIRDDSYVQFNMYPETMKKADRKYLQDIHEDGHLITYVKPNAPGLLIYARGMEQLINMEPDEAIVMTGSLLTELTDGDVPPLYHAVLDLNLPAARASLIYNVNALYTAMPSVKGRTIQMRAIANQHHAEFWQYPYHSV